MGEQHSVEFPVLTFLALPSAVLLSTVRLRLQMGLFLLTLSSTCRPFPHKSWRLSSHRHPSTVKWEVVNIIVTLLILTFTSPLRALVESSVKKGCFCVVTEA